MLYMLVLSLMYLPEPIILFFVIFPLKNWSGWFCYRVSDSEWNKLRFIFWKFSNDHQNVIISWWLAMRVVQLQRSSWLFHLTVLEPTKWVIIRFDKYDISYSFLIFKYHEATVICCIFCILSSSIRLMSSKFPVHLSCQF